MGGYINKAANEVPSYTDYGWLQRNCRSLSNEPAKAMCILDCDVRPDPGTFPSNCYIDKKVRDLPYLAADPIPDKTDSVTWCRTECGTLGYTYAAVQDAIQCFCGNEFGEYGQAPDDDCNKTCPDGVNICGSDWRQNIYYSM